MGKYEDMLDRANYIFKKVAEEIIKFSNSKIDTLEKWSDQHPVAEGRGEDQRIGFITKTEFSDDISFVMDIVNIPKDNIYNLRIWVIRTEVDSNGDEVFNQVQLTFDMEAEIAGQEIRKKDSFNAEDILHVLKREKLLINRAVLSNNTGINKKTDKRLGLRQDYDFVNKTLFTSSDRQPKEDILTGDLSEEELKRTIKIIMEHIEKPRAMK